MNTIFASSVFKKYCKEFDVMLFWQQQCNQLKPLSSSFSRGHKVTQGGISLCKVVSVVSNCCVRKSECYSNFIFFHHWLWFRIIFWKQKLSLCYVHKWRLLASWTSAIQQVQLLQSFLPFHGGFVYPKEGKEGRVRSGIPHVTLEGSYWEQQCLTSVVLWCHRLRDDLPEGLQPLLLLLLLLAHEDKLPLRRVQRDAAAPAASSRAPPAALWSGVAMALRADEDGPQLRSILTGTINITQRKPPILSFHIRQLNVGVFSWKCHPLPKY